MKTPNKFSEWAQGVLLGLVKNIYEDPKNKAEYVTTAKDILTWEGFSGRIIESLEELVPKVPLKDIRLKYSITGGKFAYIDPVKELLESSNLDVTGMDAEQILEGAWGQINKCLPKEEKEAALEYVSIEVDQ